MELDKNHVYYYQVVTQMYCTKYSFYADFVVWSPTELKIQRIYKSLENENIWKEIISKCSIFFQQAILPELLGKFYSNKQHEVNLPQPPQDSNIGSKRRTPKMKAV